MIVTSFSVLFTGTEIAATRPRVISWTVASMSLGIMIATTNDEHVLDAADDE